MLKGYAYWAANLFIDKHWAANEDYNMLGKAQQIQYFLFYFFGEGRGQGGGLFLLKGVINGSGLQ